MANAHAAAPARTWSLPVPEAADVFAEPADIEWSQGESLCLAYTGAPAADGAAIRWEVADKSNLWISAEATAAGGDWRWTLAPTQTCLPAGRYAGRVALYESSGTNCTFHRVAALQSIRVHASLVEGILEADPLATNVETWVHSVFGRMLDECVESAIATNATVASHTASIAELERRTDGCVNYVADYEGNKTAVVIGEPMSDTVPGVSSFANGYLVAATGDFAHAEGHSTLAAGEASHAEGAASRATGGRSHAEGWSTASGAQAHSEGSFTEASGMNSHAEGQETVASGVVSRAAGLQARSTHHYSSVWNGDWRTNYASHGEGTYNVNPVGGADGFFVGDTPLSGLIVPVPVIRTPDGKMWKAVGVYAASGLPTHAWTEYLGPEAAAGTLTLDMPDNRHFRMVGAYLDNNTNLVTHAWEEITP